LVSYYLFALKASHDSDITVILKLITSIANENIGELITLLFRIS